MMFNAQKAENSIFEPLNKIFEYPPNTERSIICQLFSLTKYVDSYTLKLNRLMKKA